MERGPAWAANAKDGVVYMRIEGMLTKQVVDATRRLQIEALRQRPKGIGIILDLGERPSLPSGEVRDYATRMAARYPEGILAHVTILGGEGFVASALRSALTGIFLVARSPYPRAVVGSASEAAQAARMHLGTSAPDAASMIRALGELREELAASSRV